MGSKVGFEVYLLVFYAKFFPDFVPVSIDCTCGQIQQFRNFFRGLTLLDKVCCLNGEVVSLLSDDAGSLPKRSYGTMQTVSVRSFDGRAPIHVVEVAGECSFRFVTFTHSHSVLIEIIAAIMIDILYMELKLKAGPALTLPSISP